MARSVHYGSWGAPTKPGRSAGKRSRTGRRWILAYGLAERTRWAEIAGIQAEQSRAWLSGAGGGARAGPALVVGESRLTWPLPRPARAGLSERLRWSLPSSGLEPVQLRCISWPSRSCSWRSAPPPWASQCLSRTAVSRGQPEIPTPSAVAPTGTPRRDPRQGWGGSHGRPGSASDPSWSQLEGAAVGEKVRAANPVAHNFVSSWDAFFGDPGHVLEVALLLKFSEVCRTTEGPYARGVRSTELFLCVFG